MRVIAGKAKGYRLQSPIGLQTRPTADRIKESLFNIIQNDILHSTVIDLFSGAGSLGIEALSRGANQAYFIDQSKNSVQAIKENLVRTKLIDLAEIIHSDVQRGMTQLKERRYHADIIFMDPPYGKDLIVPTIAGIVQNSLLQDQGMIIVEHENLDEVPAEIGHLTLFRQKNYGKTTISFYTTREEGK
ncbi:putative methyltransferase [Alkaliphilus metalliredigens QYMF]|uniref:Putative methyltransferase n=1 Tax=Alkaliphilus metalliredigens (strain QYMF) TaxID=293826 RepID=A6TRV1_ALKMQ|nr:16S rRNA (guanine(966)-N(2))-methyltransferase RsmD [Alkaliphilus metalliredigens]ABR48919.1 putative methyltransferase [Alkaliphilus metalliredigens QYMF]